MKMRVLPLFAAILLCTSIASAQVGEVVFDNMEHDFGSVKEEDGPVTHEFKFTNQTQAPVKILTVRASCGCTTPGWTKEEIAPGKTGFVKAQYNPYNRPGPFNKTLTVTTTARKNIVLRIKGNVVPRVKTTEEQFPRVLGDLRFKTTSLNMSRIASNVPVSKEFEFLNGGDSPVQFTDQMEIPDHIKVTVPSEAIPGGEKGQLVITYDAKMKNDYGFMIDDIVLYTNESTNNEKRLKVYATIDPYIPPMSREERALAPSMVMDKSIVDLGTVQQGELVEKEVMITNNGKSPLEIIMAKPSCDCTSVELSKQKVEPGEEITLKISFDSSGIRGNQQKYVTVYSNDPSGPTKRITLKGVVN